MISKTTEANINDWVKSMSKDKNEVDAISYLIKAYIEEQKIDWNTPSGRKSAIDYINEFYDGKSKQGVSFNDNLMNHQQSVSNPFEISLEDICKSYSSDEDNISVIGDYSVRIDSLPFPLEVKEVLKELDDQSYTSCFLLNFNKQGRLKIIRKAKILAYLHNK